MFPGARVATAIAAALPGLALADEPTTLLTVGENVVTVSEAEQVLRRTPRAALERLAKKRSKILERFVNRYLVSPALLEEAARIRAESDAEFRVQLRPKLDYALQRALERELSLRSDPSPEQVKAFYERHKKHYKRPEGIRLWRILLKNAELANKIIRDVHDKADGAARFRKLARAHSLDTATKMRAGDLGFVWPNGHTDVPQVRVQRSLVEAASKLKDGELAPEPVVEGEYLAVLWRRGTRPAVTRTLESESQNIEALVRRDLAREKLGALVGELRARHLVEGDLTLLESIKYPTPSVRPIPRPTPTQHATLGKPQPDAKPSRGPQPIPTAAASSNPVAP